MWVIWAWLMVAFGGVSIAAGIVGGILAPSVILDIVSFWPLVALGAVVGIVLLLLHRRLAGSLFPLLLIVVLAAAVGLHLLGWSRLPSAAADLSGPLPGSVSAASLKIDLPGKLAVGPGGGALYTVRLDREGGDLGVPEALESGPANSTFSVEIRQRDGGRWFRTNGWTVSLDKSPVWTLDLSSMQLDADLRSLHVTQGTFQGSGRVAVGAEASELTVSGAIVLEVPADASVELHGPATVPAGWEATTDGWKSPGSSEAVVRVDVTDGSDVVIKQP
jgi:hypothetical protein